MTDVTEIARGVVAAHEPDFADAILEGQWDRSAPMDVARDAVQAGINAALENLNETGQEPVDADA